MNRVVGAQVAGLLLALIVSTLVVFGSLFVAPGDPISVLAGGRRLSPEAIESLRQTYSLDDPFFTQYWGWLTGILHGDFGISITSRQPVADLLGPRIGSTALLLALASVFMAVVGIGLGLLAGLGGKKTDGAVRTVTTLGVAIPQFVVAIVLISIFSVGLGLFPVFGSGNGFFDQLYHLFLPAIALALAGLAYIARVTRVAVKTEASREHVQTAESRGVPRREIVRRHILRNAMIPITTVTGLMIAGTISSTVVVETAFGLDGLGSLLVQAVTAKDFAVVQAVSLILVSAFLVINLLVDLGYYLIDPRIRSKGQG
jgi:peptide/nickel transport system permease protein